MKNTFYILILFILLSSCGLKKNETSSNDLIVQEDKDISVKTSYDNEHIILKLFNKTSKKKYILTSYLDNRFTYNDNLYTIKNDTIIANFKPIYKYLGTVKTDVLIVDDNSVLSKKQAIYEFLEIPPTTEISIKFYIKHLSKTPYYENSNILNFTFAIYENIDLLKVVGVEYDKRYQKAFADQAKNYKIVEAILKIR